MVLDGMRYEHSQNELPGFRAESWHEAPTHLNTHYYLQKQFQK